MRINFTNPRVLLLTGNAVTLALVAGSMLLVSRIYAPDTIGRWSICLACINIIWSFSQLRTDLAMLQAEAQEKRMLLDLGLCTHFLLSLPLIGVGAFFHILGKENPVNLFFVVAVMSHGIQQMNAAWLLSERRYQTLNLLRISNALLAYPGSLALFYWLGEKGLLAALCLGNLLPSMVLWSRSALPLPFRSGFLPHTIELIKRYRKTASFLSAGNLLLSLSEQAVVLLMAAFFSPFAAAAYFMAARLCNQPLSFVQTAMSQYNYRFFQDLYEEGKFSAGTIVQYWIKWLPAAVAFYLPIVCWGAPLFAWVLGAQWAFAGHLASILALASALRFLSSPTSMGFFIIGRQEIFFVFTVLITAVTGLCGLFAYQGKSIETIVNLLVTGNTGITVAYNAVMLALIVGTLKRKI